MISSESYYSEDDWSYIDSGSFDSGDDFDLDGEYPLSTRRLPTETSFVALDEMEYETFRTEAPEGSYYRSIGDAITRQLTGFNKNELQRGFKRAWQKDKQLGKVLGGIKMSIRCLGFAVGTTINLASRVATLPLAFGFGVLTAVAQFVFTPVKTFKNPKAVLENTMTGGVAGGVIVAGCIGMIGLKVSKTMMSIEFDSKKEDGSKINVFERSGVDNALIGMVGAGVAAGVSCVYPAMWQLPFRG